MPKLPRLKSQKLIKALQGAGFFTVKFYNKDRAVSYGLVIGAVISFLLIVFLFAGSTGLA